MGHYASKVWNGIGGVGGIVCHLNLISKTGMPVTVQESINAAKSGNWSGAFGHWSNWAGSVIKNAWDIAFPYIVVYGGSAIGRALGIKPPKWLVGNWGSSGQCK